MDTARPSLSAIPPGGQIRPASLLPEIDWQHPLANGLLWYTLDTGFSGQKGAASFSALDLIYGLFPFRLGITDGAALQTPYGPVSLWPGGTAASLSFGGSGSLVQSATAGGNYTFACAFIKTGAVGSFSRPFGRTANNGASAPFVNWDFEINPSAAGQNVIIANCNNGGTLATTAQYTGLSDNTYITAVGTLSGGAGSSTLDLYINGVHQAATASSTLTPASANTNADILVSGSSSAGIQNDFTGGVFWTAFWNRVLSLDEINTLHIDPYSLLAAGREEFTRYVFLVATAANFDVLIEEVLLADTGTATFDVMAEEILLADTGVLNFDFLVQEILTAQSVPSYRRPNRTYLIR